MHVSSSSPPALPHGVAAPLAANDVLVIAHRANRAGAEPATENSLAMTRVSIERGWSVETDIRRAPSGRFYISHDPAPWSASNDADAFCDLWRDAPGPIALNIKELGHEAALIAYLAEQQVLDRVFLFDMELLEPTPGETARRFRALNPTVRLGARVSERGETVARALSIDCADVVWLDEFDGPWATARDVDAIRHAGRTVYAVSPELHGRTGAVMHRRWEQFVSWGVHGICTDHPEALATYLTTCTRGAATQMVA